ncbi:MAG: Gfo/Idh/MocA family oxidoreductase, partial [Planctomycetes bacterium]|nr:Gfo/Idh/MocA family oxidoreductase [Planctomycetota bacterium]
MAKKYNVGIVGYGWAAGAHIAAINAGTLGQVTKICSSRALDPGELSLRHGTPIRTYTDLGAMLVEPDLDVVSITSY